MQERSDEKQPDGLAPAAVPVGAVEEEEHEHGWKHWAMMALCCLPMIALLVLALLGVWGAR